MHTMLILRAMFVDRAGRTAFQMTPAKIQEGEDGTAQMMEGPPCGLVRLSDIDKPEDALVEWFDEPEAPEPDGGIKGAGLVPGVDGDGTG